MPVARPALGETRAATPQVDGAARLPGPGIRTNHVRSPERRVPPTELSSGHRGQAPAG